MNKKIIVGLICIVIITCGIYVESRRNSYDKAYEKGMDEGLQKGRELGIHDGIISGNETGYGDGFISGNEIGYDDGIISGNETGYIEGLESGSVNGYSDGYLDGYDMKYSDGYELGIKDGLLGGHNMGHFDGNLTGLVDGYDDGIEYISGNYDVVDPNYGEVLKFVEDKTLNFDNFRKRANDLGFHSFWVVIEFPSSIQYCNAFNTTDMGIIFIYKGKIQDFKIGDTFYDREHYNVSWDDTIVGFDFVPW